MSYSKTLYSCLQDRRRTISAYEECCTSRRDRTYYEKGWNFNRLPSALWRILLLVY